jgi:hypothetical protein
MNIFVTLGKFLDICSSIIEGLPTLVTIRYCPEDNSRLVHLKATYKDRVELLLLELDRGHEKGVWLN